MCVVPECLDNIKKTLGDYSNRKIVGMNPLLGKKEGISLMKR
jgi:hypothetical protein